MNLGEKIKELRIKNNLTQSALANMLYVSDKTISSWEVSRTIPDVDMLFKLAKVLNTSIYNLVEDNYYNALPLEIEVKLKLDEYTFNKLLNLIKTKEDNLKEVHQIDTYFNLNKKEYKEVLRIRNENNKYILGYKKENKDKSYEEYESIIDNPLNIERILIALGLKKMGLIEKKRIKILYKEKYEFAFDNVKNIGLFLEIEVKRFDEDNLNEINKLIELLHEFNLDLNLIDSKRYSDYLN